MIFAALVVFTQAKLIAGSGLLKDVDVLERTYKALHPGLYRHNTPEQINSNFDDLRTRLKGGATPGQAFLAFSEFTAKIRCGHTYPNFYNQPDEIVTQVLTPGSRLPFYFLWLSNRMVVTKNFSSASLPPGSEITKIDGHSTLAILKRLMAVARADGSNDAKRRAYVEVQGLDKYEAFDIYFNLYYPKTTNDFVLTARLPGATSQQQVIVHGITFDDRLKLMPNKQGEKDAPLWSFKFIERDVALLTMPTWAMYNSKWDWTRFLDDCFGHVARNPKSNLIVDLRGNEGGNDCGNEVIRHLVATPLSLGGYERFTKYRWVPAELKPYLDTWDRTFSNWGTAAGPPRFVSAAGTELRRLVRYDDGPEGDVIQPKPPLFKGKVIVLMDSQNSSATFQFERAIRDFHLGTLVGEPSGGNLRGINGGAFFFLNLPNSKIELDVPLIATIPNVPQPDRGLMPQVLVRPTRASIAAGRDLVLNQAIALAR